MEIGHYQTHICILFIYLVSSFHLTLFFSFSLYLAQWQKRAINYHCETSISACMGVLPD